MHTRLPAHLFSILSLFTAPIAWSAPGGEASFYNQWQSQIQSEQALNETETRLQAAYNAAKKAMGKESGEARQLSREQQTWDKARRAKALARGMPGSPAFNQELIDQAEKRIRELDTITAKGRVLAYHQYQLSP